MQSALLEMVFHNEIEMKVRTDQIGIPSFPNCTLFVTLNIAAPGIRLHHIQHEWVLRGPRFHQD
jgi:hypothetical protein